MYWDNCNNAEHAVSLGILYNTIFSCATVGDDGNQENVGGEIVVCFSFLGNFFRLNVVVTGVKL